jgi:hypothetical protein
MSVAPESGRNRIMIYGPKSDGTYVVEFSVCARAGPFTRALGLAGSAKARPEPGHLVERMTVVEVLRPQPAAEALL